MTQKLPEEAVKHYIAAGVVALELWFPKAEFFVESHKHNYDHLSLLCRGKVKVTVDGVETIYTAPTGIVIGAGKVHTIQALEDETLWYCIHSIPEDLRDAEVIGAYLIQKE